MSAPRRRKLVPRQTSTWSRISVAWKRVIFLASGAAALGTAITLVPKVIPIVEPFAPAHHEWVRETQEPLVQQSNIMLYRYFQDQKNNAKNAEGGWTVQLQKEKDPASRALIQQQIDHARADQQKFDQRIQQLKVPDWVR